MTKRFSRLGFAVAAIVGLGAGGFAHQGVPTTTPADVRRILSALADDSMEGRASGTRGHIQPNRLPRRRESRMRQ